jgi:KDO2-lipid IV(A) lauroyltransferase
MRPKSDAAGKDLSRFLQNQTNVLLARVLPLAVYHRYLELIGFYYFGVNASERRNLLKSLHYVLDGRLDKSQFLPVVLKTCIGICAHYSEKMINAHKSLSTMARYLLDNVTISGEEWLVQVHRRKQGCLFVTCHFGAVEYIPLYLAACRYRPAIILRFKTGKLKEALRGKSKEVDLELIDADCPNVLFRALDAIRQGRILITLCDEVHSWRPSKSETALLFGRLIPKDRTLDILYGRSRARSCFGVIRRKSKGFELTIHPLADGAQRTSLCEAAWRLLEQYVYRYPQQWYQWPNFYPEFIRYQMGLQAHAN